MLKLNFSPESDNPPLLEASYEYQSIWNEDGQKIIEVMEKISGLTFRSEEISVIVYEGMSFSGSNAMPMKLRASYPLEVKKGTLVHELGHRLIEQLSRRPSDLDEHGILFLILYDIWVELYGIDFADQMVKVEKQRKWPYDYALAWVPALSLTKEERQERFKSIK